MTGTAPLAFHPDSKTKPSRVRVTAPGVPVVVPPPVGSTFYDDFTGDLSKWNLVTEWPDTGLSKSSTNDPSMVSVSNGQLLLRCERGTPLWKSAVIDTKVKFQQLYGIFEAQISYPAGQGLWPAFWLLEGNGKTGKRPELDVMEAYPHPGSGGGVTQYAMTNHWTATNKFTTWCKPGFDLTTGPHVFGLEWRKDLLVARLDGKEMGRQTANVPAVPMFLILDLVVGSWAGLPDATTPSSAVMKVDWVRVQA